MKSIKQKLIEEFSKFDSCFYSFNYINSISKLFRCKDATIRITEFYSMSFPYTIIISRYFYMDSRKIR